MSDFNNKKLLKKIFTNKLILFLLLGLFSCKENVNKTNDSIENQQKPKLVDKSPTKQAIKLYNSIKKLPKQGFAIGHQDATSYGLDWKHADSPDSIKSDVQQVTGKFPAVYGFDIGHIELGRTHNLDSVPFETMKNLMILAYKNGGIITVSWHLRNPTTGGDSWDKTSAVADIIEGGKHHDKYKLWVKRVANFFKTVKIGDELVPIVFRPYHEMNGSWFWWGDKNCSAEDYKTLWQETIRLLRDKHNLHNLLYAYSPNKLNPDDDYMKYYPGDNYVDILGIDIYDFKNSEDYIKSLKHDLALVKKIASQKQMPYAFTETGLETLSTPNWFTKVLYPNIKDSGISWILLWRNHSTDHHYMPYPGHPIVDDLKAFEALPKTLFLDDLN